MNPSAQASLEAKAPKLWAWSGSEKVDRWIVRASGDAFLDELRAKVWRAFVERLHRESLPTFSALTGIVLGTPPPLPAGLSSDDLYDLHLDTCGVPQGQPARTKRPNNSMQLLGAVQIGLLNAGAQVAGSHYVLNSKKIRVVYGQGRLLSAVRRAYGDESSSFIIPDTTICVGAKDDGGAPPDVVRGAQTSSTIIRPSTSRNWGTEESMKVLWAGQGNDDATATAD